MIRLVVLLLVFWVPIFVLLWNVKKWKWSITKTIIIALGCSVITTILFGLIVGLIMLLGN